MLCIEDFERISRFNLPFFFHQLLQLVKGISKPLLKGWRDHRSTDVLMDDLEATFAEGTSYNLGVVMRPPYVAADLDSKPDLGESVRAWLAENPSFPDLIK